jgi:hypothetical protein
MTVGNVELPAITPIVVSPGTYWLMGNYSPDAQIAKGGANVDIKYISLLISAPLPTTFGTHTTYTSTDIGYYIVGY